MSLPDLDQLAARTILVVDDEVLVRLAIAEYLRDCGFTVHEAAHADEAITVLTTATVSVDLVFSDVQMPAGSMDGFGLARWVAANQPGVTVILTSGASQAVQRAADLCQHGPLLAKPYDEAEVLARIRRSLADSPRLPPPGAGVDQGRGAPQS